MKINEIHHLFGNGPLMDHNIINNPFQLQHKKDNYTSAIILGSSLVVIIAIISYSIHKQKHQNNEK